MDVHRARFIPYPTHSISCLAFTRTNDRGLTAPLPALKLAIGRGDGSIEIWNPHNGSWVQEIVFPPVHDKAVDSLVWTQDPDEHTHDGRVIAGQYRLFSAGADTKPGSDACVIEWDLASGTIKRKSTGNFPGVWCLAAQPRSIRTPDEKSDDLSPSQELIAGCSDGSLVLFSTDDDDLQFKRFLVRGGEKKGKCLTVTYQKPHIVVAGYNDSSIQIWNTKKSRNMRIMSVGMAVGGSKKKVMVWKLACLPNGDIVSADSNGELHIWDGKTLSLAQRITAHERDCYDIVVGSTGDTLMSVGVDGRLASYQRSTVDRGRVNWSKTSHRRVRQDFGPLKTLALYDSSELSVVVTGGDDPSPIVAPFRRFGHESLRFLPFLPQHPQVVSAVKSRYIASWWQNTLAVYRIAKQGSLESLVRDDFRAHQLVAKIQLSVEETIRAAAISAVGNIIAVATSTSVKVFQLKRRNPYADALAVRRISIPTQLAKTGAKLLSISADGNWLAVATTENEVQVARFDAIAERPKLLQILTPVAIVDRFGRALDSESGLDDYNRSIVKMSFSHDSSTLITGDLDGSLDSWILDGDYSPEATAASVETKAVKDEDSSDSEDDDDEVLFYGQRWIANPASSLPQLDSAPLALVFRPAAQQELLDSQLGIDGISAHRQLIAISASHKIYEFDLDTGRLTEWSRRNPSSMLPKDFTKIGGRIMDAIFDDRNRLWLYGSSFLFMLDLESDLLGNKRKRDDDTKRSKKKVKSGAGQISYERGTGTVMHEAGRASISNGVKEEESHDDIDLAQLRRGSENIDETNESLALQTTDQQHQSWSTLKYGPILGIVPLSIADPHAKLEVVIVERPVGNGTTRKKKQ